MNRTRTLRTLALALLAAAAAAEGCGGGNTGASDAVRATPRAVTIHRIETDRQGPGLTLPARVTAREEVTVRAAIAGRVTGIPFLEGQRFDGGSTLVRFDAPEAKGAVAAARAGAAAAAVRLDIARKQEVRMDSLYAQRVAALHELELAEGERRAAEAADAEARASLAALEAGVGVPAPFAGVVVRRHVDVGASVAPGQPLLDIRSLGSGEVVAAVPEGAVGLLDGARVTVETGDGAWRPAVVTRIDGMTDFATRTRNARFRLASEGTRLVPGAFARVRIEPPPGTAPGTGPGGNNEPASRLLTIPSRCLVRRGSLVGAFLVRDGRADLRWLRVGRADSLDTEVLAGLAPGDSIVVDPGDLADGAPVTVAP
jgi:RND family efflux transporter MFP subunit